MTMVLNGTSGVTTNSGTLISATTIGVGGTTPSASGAGVSFPATQSASSEANTLDDYEEGTWTPTFTFGGSNTGMGFSINPIGYYTKVGRLVTITCYFALSTKGSSTGNAVLGGLPFVSANLSSQYTRCPIYLNSLATALTGNDVSYLPPNSGTITLAQLAGQTTTTNLSNSNFGNGSDFMCTFSYNTAT